MVRRTLVTTPVGVEGAGHRGSFPCKTRDLLSRVLVLGTEVPTSKELTPFLKHHPAVGFLFASANLREGVLKWIAGSLLWSFCSSRSGVEAENLHFQGDPRGW